ncbi:hypothetical protein DLJ47_21785 [Micromonospora sp. S4605]|uniref:hypothetical protein n=1 Tax=Micromonospora sp. S4605 TaxID=1420897 RepID=UPI000D6FED14|nr:hypothetical protein [Micromonospora sp. S4605]PWU51223.1 hypothetical protein DLJ47_21785 [Micromonospora sp. S4605]
MLTEDEVFDAVVRRITTDGYLDGLADSRSAALRPASPAAVAEAEELAGRPLPSLLRRLYLEVGNGGFGPGYGLLGLRGGHRMGALDALVALERGVLILCDWGCGITSELDLATGQVWGCDPNPAPDGVSCAFPQHMTIVDWFAKWVAGTLCQPWLVQDPTTGEWRGATDIECAEMLQEAFGPNGPED